MAMTSTEENYLKSIYNIQQQSLDNVASTSLLSNALNTSAPTVTEMLKKLHEKDLIDYVKYSGASLTEKGLQLAVILIRKHRLWETFLFKKLKISWYDIHDIAEQLEHINSELLIEKLDEYLQYPIIDPHGDPIPNAKGEIKPTNKLILAEAPNEIDLKVIGVANHQYSFLHHLDQLKLQIDSKIKILEKWEFDNSLVIELDGNKMYMSKQVAESIYVTKNII